MRERDRAIVAIVGVFETMGTVVLDTGRVRVIRVTRAVLDRWVLRCLGAADAPSIDWSWTTETQRKHYRFTMQALFQGGYGPIERESIAVLRTHAASRIALRALSSMPGQELEVLLNGQSCGTVPIALEWTDASVAIPPGARDPSGLQRIGLRWSKTNEYRFGVALSTLRVE